MHGERVDCRVGPSIGRWRACCHCKNCCECCHCIIFCDVLHIQQLMFIGTVVGYTQLPDVHFTSGCTPLWGCFAVLLSIQRRYAFACLRSKWFNVRVVGPFCWHHRCAHAVLRCTVSVCELCGCEFSISICLPCIYDLRCEHWLSIIMCNSLGLSLRDG